MATTYTTLLTEVASYLARSDLTSIIPTFVQLAQARINRQVRAKAMETKSTSFSIANEYENVPSDFLEAKSFYLTSTTPRLALEYMADDLMTNSFNTSDKPRYFSVVGSQFRFSPTPDATYTATLVYYAKPATLAAGTQETNSLFPTNPDLYLYASLLEAESYLHNDARLAVWKAGYDEALAHINEKAKGSRHGGPMRTRPDSAVY